METATASAIDQIFSYAIVEIIDQADLRARLEKGEKLVVKLGVDPTSADLHLGHAIVLRKLRQFQDVGCEAVLVIGDFTAKIGDPSGRNTTRPVLSDDEIKHNLQTYIAQADLILDKSKTKVVFNSKWLSQITLERLITIGMNVSLSTLLDRDDFASRIKAQAPISFHELLYPISQAIDSVELKADVELGGWDQRLNLLLGRELQKKLGQRPQNIVIINPLVGVDGERKMSKSYGNYIGLTESADQMYGKIMSIPDKLIDSYAELAALLSAEEIKNLPNHPRDRKAAVAHAIVRLYHSQSDADAAAERFRQTFSQKSGATELADEIQVEGDTLTVLEAVKLASGVSGSEATRLINQNAVKLDGVVVTDQNQQINVKAQAHQLQVGKHRFYELAKEA
jgi:tyrosyl-tRNA synthetase